MSKNTLGGLILLFLLVAVFIEAVALFALWNTWFKLAIAQWALWSAGMILLATALGGAWERFVLNETKEGGH